MALSLVSSSNQNFVTQFRCNYLQIPRLHFSLNLDTTIFPKSTSLVQLKLEHPISRASSEDFPAELVEDSKFVPLSPEDPQFGPPVILLLGYQMEEAQKIQQLLKELEGEFIKIVLCTEDMINRSLWEAVNTEHSNLDASKIATSLPHICVLSGLTGEEMMMFIDAFTETGLEPPAFAALVPNSADKLLSELIEEIMGDHEMLSARQTS